MLNNIARNVTMVAGHCVGRAMGVQYGPSIVNWGINRCVSGYIPQFLCRIAVHGAIESSLGYANIGAAVFLFAAQWMPSPQTIHERTTAAINQATNYSRNNSYQQLSAAGDSHEQIKDIPSAGGASQAQTTETPKQTLTSSLFGAFQMETSDDGIVVISTGSAESMETSSDNNGVISTHATETEEGFVCVDAYSNDNEMTDMNPQPSEETGTSERT